uniref:Plasmolipin n=1 Tax=Xiphophorus couchianus TaxID=32473 RepID=A0A3B5LCM5_9TELE
MADFPSKVTTETSSPQPQQGAGRLLSSSVLQVLGLLHWALIAGAPYWLVPAYGWVMFVAVTLWILTTLLFLVLLFSVPQILSAVPWTMTVMMYNAVAALLYLTAFLTNAATVRMFKPSFVGHIGAAAFFGAVLTLLYGAGAYLSYLDWRADGGNAATTTVPT